MKTTTTAIVAPFAVIVFFIMGVMTLYSQGVLDSVRRVDDTRRQDESLTTYASCEAITDALQTTQERGYSNFLYKDFLLSPTSQSASESVTPDYSTTNVQVEGVDEADIVKTDGTYMYALSHGNLTISKAYPATEARLTSTTSLSLTPSELFIDDDRLTVLGVGTPQVLTEQSGTARIMPPDQSNSFMTAVTYDISDASDPRFVRSVEIEGTYVTSRKIESTIYFVVTSYPDYRVYTDDNTSSALLPLYRDTGKEISASVFSPISSCDDIAYFPDVTPQQFITVGSFDIDDETKPLVKETILGSSEAVYSSQQTLYIAATQYAEQDLIGDILQTPADEKTTVHTFSLDDGAIAYTGHLEAPGHVLNQFSMDEHKSFFRIATTTGEVSRSNESAASSGVYIFNDHQELVGQIDKLAPGEKIYSARFTGDKAYLVTFQKVDPLFVLDLTNPESPELLGKLKIPGYSDYLHPYDENHVIGVGKDTIAAEEGNFAWYQGLKLALFDVTDVSNPKELFKTTIGDRGTDSYALHDHKAFLFDYDKNLLILPVLLAEIDEETKTRDEVPNTYGEYTYQGAYIFSLDLTHGFTLKGKVTHYDSDELFTKSGYRYYGDGNSIQRALYIGDNIYTISANKILINRLSDVSLLGTVMLCTEVCDDPVIYY
ncbi:MAG: beta-propeller domain-containing protein [Patescibacteria group bacterium]|jgi:uncharacterized secreted protein with C-terminal beta-propeller domain